MTAGPRTEAGLEPGHEPGPGPVRIVPLHGIPEVVAGDDLADLVDLGLSTSGVTLEDGDVLVLSSKVASKALGLVVDEHDGADKTAVIAAETVRVVAERLADGRVTRVVQSVAGPVMAAAGVDASNTGERGGWLVLPADPDAVCRALHAELTRRHGVRLGVLLSDTAGRPWRVGQTDFALGAHGLSVLEDLRGGRDLDGRDLSVTMRALADEVASAADLVKGKATGVPVAVVRGVRGLVPEEGATTPELGARGLVRTGPQDWFGHGRLEAVRSALGVEAGTALAAQVGIPSVLPESRSDRVARAVRLALVEDEGATADVGQASVTLGADDPYALGRLAARLATALWCEALVAEAGVPAADGCSVDVAVRDR
ncbi:MAG: F420-dependent oxidoreductase [Humibacillus sp.]|nr:F420-dependent oxidoreductase [Humibacillus sp.]